MLVYDLATKKIVEKPDPGYYSLSKQPHYAQRFPTRIVKFGYERGPDPLLFNTFIRPNKEVFWLISHAFELIDCKGYPLRKTLEIVSSKGLRSKHGKSMAISTLFKILTDRFYAGLVWKEGQWLVATHAPAVSKERFDRVQERLAVHRRSPGKTTKNEPIVQESIPQQYKKEQKM